MNVVFHQQALGDFAVALPLLRGLAPPTTVVAPWSRAQLTAALIPGVAAMDIELFEFTRLHAPDGLRAMSPAVGELFEQASTIFTFVSEPGDAWSENVARIAPHAQVVHVAPRPPKSWKQHVSLWHREQVERAGVMLEDRKAARRGDPAGPVVVHPGSGGDKKCWPTERFEQVIAALKARGRAVRVIYGEAEAQRWDAATLQRWKNAHAATGCGSLEQLAEVLSAASGYLGNDAGPTHVAAQLGLPTVAMFGPSDPALWRPIGPAVTVLHPEEPGPMTWLNVETVLAAVAAAEG